MRRRRAWARGAAAVSVLFSEPKIPQSTSPFRPPLSSTAFQCSSASRKFLNAAGAAGAADADAFQCSSASRKFLNFCRDCELSSRRAVSVLFSEPKIPQSKTRRFSGTIKVRFQCSSASRKFLNRRVGRRNRHHSHGFSALQRAENSSIASRGAIGAGGHLVSVLFNEPKLLKSTFDRAAHSRALSFSALQRAEIAEIIASRRRS